MIIKTLYDESHDSEWLEQCENCKKFWFHRFHEYVSFVSDDEITVWYTLLTNDEADEIIKSEERPDLSYLENKPSIMFENDTCKLVNGQPSYPWV